MKYHISLEYKKKYFELFVLGYTADGGFFVKDLINDGKKYLIIKMFIPEQKMKKIGRYSVSLKKSQHWVATNSPKLGHHVDGTVHVSGTEITSGIYKFFSGHKGVSTQSMDLHKGDNDGGPIFIFYTKNLYITKYKKINNITIKQADQIIDFTNPPFDENDYAFSLEFFYLSKKNILTDPKSLNGVITFKHPNYGMVPLRCLPAPDHSPGVIAVFTRVTSKGTSENQFSFSLNGGAGKISENREFEHISIVYPFEKEMVGNQKVKNLDFVALNKFKTTMDNFFYKIKVMVLKFKKNLSKY